MANGVMSDSIKTRALNEMLAVHPWDRLEMGLFTGVTVPTHATVLGDLSEQTGMGYARQTVENWIVAVLTGTFHAFSTADAVVFENTGGSDWDQTTGWFFVDTLDDTLVLAGRFLGPFVLPAGQVYPTTPFVLLTGE